MRSSLPPRGTLLTTLAVSTLALAGCALPNADGNASTGETDKVVLSFSYEADGGDGYIDQTLTIANSGAAAGAPVLDITPLDASGAVVPGIEVVTAYGSDAGDQVVPAYTEVTDVLKFKGKRADDVVDVEVTVADLGTLEGDYPPANDLSVKRYDIEGKSGNDNTIGSVLVKNPYDQPITIKVAGIEFADTAKGDTQHFKQVSTLLGPITLQPKEKLREKVAVKYRLRFFGSVRAYLVPDAD